MKLHEVSLPTTNETKIIDCIIKSQKDTKYKARILAYLNSLTLAKADIDKNQLYAMLLKDYILNRGNGKVNTVVELDEMIDMIDLSNDKAIKDNLCLLIQYLDIDYITRYALAFNYINTVSSKNIRYQGIRKNDEDKCMVLCDKLNRIIETKVQKEECKRYTRVSNR